MIEIKVNLYLCVGCGGCNTLCEFGILDLRDGQAEVVEDLSEKCTECGECVEGCPEKAISM